MKQNLQHKNLALSWRKLSFSEQMANIGSEVERAMNWKEKSNQKFSQKAFFRSLELFNLTLQSLAKLENSKSDQKISYLPKLTEVARSKELFSDYIYGDNQYKSTRLSWQKYFRAFNYVARKTQTTF
jgi:hypothetical protein